MKITYDSTWIFPINLETPDQLLVQARYDPLSMQLVWVQDANGSVHEAAYDAAGRVIATTFFGHEDGELVGFAPISSYVRLMDHPADALASPTEALGSAASACFYDPFAWMGQIDSNAPLTIAEGVEKRWLMPGGYVRASARRKFAQTACPEALQAAIDTAAQSPPNSLVLQADRYPGDLGLQIRMSMTYSDGFGRVLQQMMRVEPGDAYVVGSDGMLEVANSVPVVAYADARWRVTARVAYNSKGLVVRTYRPYFTNSHYYVRDDVLESVGVCDRQYYDPLNRPTISLRADGYMKRLTQYSWYSISEDENDTADELEKS